MEQVAHEKSEELAKLQGKLERLEAQTAVVDLGRGPGSPVPGYRLGSRESVRLGRFH